MSSIAEVLTRADTPPETRATAASAPAARGYSRRAVAWMGAALSTVILILYLLLQNPFWVRGGDSEVYICIARNILIGKGIWFNGQPVAMVPPGWPLLLAGVMSLSSAFAVLKLVPMLSMAGALAMYFFVLCRFAPAHRAALCVLATALLAAVFPLTYWFHAEGFFCLLAVGALLLAMQINEGKRQWWRIAAMTALLGMSLTARPAGVLWWPIVAGALLRGELPPRLNRLWIAAGISLIFLIAVFFGLRRAMYVPEDRIDPRFDASLSIAYDITNETEEDETYLQRILDANYWIAGLLWPRTVTFGELRQTTGVAAWVVVALCAITLCGSVRRRQWVWLGAAAYYSALVLNWPHPVARYLVPIAPLLVLGTLQGLTLVASWVGGRWREDLGLALRSAAAGLILLPNFGAYAVEVWAMRSPDFYARYQGGVDETLVAAAHTLLQKGLKDGELVVSRRYATLTSDGRGNGWMRAAALLTSRAVMTMPDDLSREPDREVIEWMKQNNARYYLYLPVVYTNGHFKLLSLRGIPVAPDDVAWRLYERRGDEIARIRILPGDYGPTHMPGAAGGGQPAAGSGQTG